MAGHEDDALGNEVVRHRDGLLGIASIVTDGESEVLAEDTALGIDVLDRLLGAVAHLIAERGVFARHRARRGDVQVLSIGSRRTDRGGERGRGDQW